MMDQRGVSLVEILMSITILAVGMLAVAEMQITSIQGNAFSGATTDGTTLAQDRMEQLMTLTYSSLTTDASLVDTDGDGDGGLDDATAASADFNQSEGDYTIYWNVSDGSLINSTKTLNVIVAWTEKSRQRRVSVQGVKPRIN
jgi:type IV pilus assembly protein PilV